MKKFFKYLAIFFIIIFILIMAGYVMAKLGGVDDKMLLSKFQDDSIQLYSETGSFSNFCSSDLYIQLESKYSHDISCNNGQSSNGNDLQIIAEFTTGFYSCRVATLPPVNSKQQKKIFCLELPEEIGNLLQ